MIPIELSKCIVKKFGMLELQDLLSFAQKNTYGDKAQLLNRCLQLIDSNSSLIHQKIHELFERRHNPVTLRCHPVVPSSSKASWDIGLTDTMRVQLPEQSLPRPATPGSTFETLPPPQHPEVQFKSLPLCKLHSIVMQPSTLSPRMPRDHSNVYEFTLASSQVHLLEGSHELLLRIGCLDSSYPQRDMHPANLSIIVNDVNCQIPASHSLYERYCLPIVITELCELNPSVTNTIILSWTTNASDSLPYVASVQLVHKLDPGELVHKMFTKPGSDTMYSRWTCTRKTLKKIPDCILSTRRLKESLICPVGNKIMKFPTVARTCTTRHQCFDSLQYFKQMQYRTTLRCPICGRIIPSLDDFEIDFYFYAICKEILEGDKGIVFLYPDGSWSLSNQNYQISDDKLFIPCEVNDDEEIEVIDLTMDVD